MKRHRLLTTEEAAERVGLTAEQLRQRHRDGNGPNYLEPSPRTIRYLAEDLDAWNTTTNH